MSLFRLALINNPVGINILEFFRAISLPDPSLRKPIGDAIRAEFERNFRNQQSGSGGWAPLAPSTVADRIRQGFPGERPILQREGNLLSSYTDPGSNDHHERVLQTGLGPAFDAGSNSPIAIFHHLGTVRMPARPAAIFDGSAENRLFGQIDRAIERIEARYL